MATSLQDCTDEQNQTIKSFLLLMHALLTIIMLIYCVLLFKTNLRVDKYADGLFIWYFCAFYLMITVLIFLIPAGKYKLLSVQTVIVSFAGLTAPPWLLSFVSKSGVDEGHIPDFLLQIWKLI